MQLVLCKTNSLQLYIFLGVKSITGLCQIQAVFSDLDRDRIRHVIQDAT